MSDPLAARTFHLNDQWDFARISGDYNPLHLDAAIASGTQAGGVAIYGAHAVLWALDALEDSNSDIKGVSSLDVSFRRFVLIDSGVEVRIRSRPGDQIALTITESSVKVIDIVAHLGAPLAQGGNRVALQLFDEATPPKRDFCEMIGRAGEIAIGTQAARAFPGAARLLGTAACNTLAAYSQLVGMECPGYYSISHRYTMTASDTVHAKETLSYAVTSTDERFRLIEMAITADRISGTVCAFVRPVEAPSA